MVEKDGETRVSYVHPRRTHLENLLHELTQREEHKRQQRVESAAAATKHKLVHAQLMHTQEELVAVQASKAKLCEEIGLLTQTKTHQAKQLDKYKTDLQTARDARAVMMNKVEQLEASTWTLKQQYIRSLASRIKTSALVLQQLNVASETARGVEQCTEWEQTKPHKRKRILEAHTGQLVRQDGSKPEPIGSLVEKEPHSRDNQLSESVAIHYSATIATTSNETVIVDDPQPLQSASHDDRNGDEQPDDHRNSKHDVAQVTKLESEYLALNDKYHALVRDHNETLATSMTSAEELKAKTSKIEELTQMLELLQSKPHDLATDTSSSSEKDKEAQEGRVKMLEENLAQMNGYADQLEMVIAQCPSCTIKLRNESTQDSVTSRTE